ncbi:MAG: hypothetical protein JNK77_00570 [Saprospiraceae bacterium]|nr:hypothetical protein [Saprospiraceae bacterium]
MFDYVNKNITMSAVHLKAEIHKYLDAVKDETFLRAVHSMLNTYLQHSEAIVGYRADNQPISQHQLLVELEAGEAQIEQGKYLTIEELMQEAEQW